MTGRLLVRFTLILFVTGIFTATLAAQTAELSPYAGGIFPSRMDTFDNNKIKAQGVYGLKGGVFVTPNAEIEGNFGYLSHFEVRNAPNALNSNLTGGFGQPSVMGFMYDLNAAWNFGQREFLNARVSPYISFGGGGLTTEIRNGGAALIAGGGSVMDAAGNLVPNSAPTKVLHDGDTFFTVNYGGGIKAMNLWGPVGLRADVRGRTIPNFFHSSPTWPEITGGLLFTWGER